MPERKGNIVLPRSTAVAIHSEPLVSSEKPQGPRRLSQIRRPFIVAGLAATTALFGRDMLGRDPVKPSTDPVLPDNPITLSTPEPKIGPSPTPGFILEPTPVPTSQPTLLLTPEPVRTETDLENSIEEEFGIEILDVREALRGLNLSSDEDLMKNSTINADDDQLNLLKKLLPFLPPDFYKGLNITFVDFSERCGCGGAIKGTNMPGHTVLFLSNSDFRNKELTNTFRGFSHELGHYKDLVVLKRSLWPEIIDILGFATFQEARDYFVPKIEKANNAGLIDNDFAFYFNYGFTGYDEGPAELVAVMVQTYVKGEKEFMKSSSFFGQNLSVKLYEFMNSNYFDGYEYFDVGLDLPFVVKKGM